MKLPAFSCLAKLPMTLAALLPIAASIAPASAQAPPPAQDWSAHAPESPSGYRQKTSVRSLHFMAATANPLATDAAYDVLDRGGSAVDAVVAAQMMLTLVEPQSSGIGGGAFLLTYDAASGKLTAWDGRETAPMAADERLFLDSRGRPLSFFSAVVGGRSVGVPGAVRMLEAAHRELGRTSWPALLAPAITTATEGFAVSPRLHALINADPFLDDDPVAAAYFHDVDGKALATGSRLRNPALAQTLQSLAEHGSAALHTGTLAREIVHKVRSHPRNPGLMTLDDLAGYRPKQREALCTPWLRWIVCGMPPPSSGAIAVSQMLGILAASPFTGLTHGTSKLDPEAVHWFSEAGRLAYADRARYAADSDFVPMPSGLLDSRYLKERATLIGERSMGIADAGRPVAGEYPERGTSHVSVVDSQGNAASLTTSIESAFGSRQMVGGFMLNNQLTDFSFAADEGAAPGEPPVPLASIANRLQPGKRPRSSMAPTLVFERAGDAAADATGGTSVDARDGKLRGRLVMVTGSPGGAAIINYVAKTLIATLQDGLDPQAAIALPNIGSRNGPTELERGRVAPALIEALKARGHEVRQTEKTSGVQSIVWSCHADTAGQAHLPGYLPDNCAWLGAADPRREGVARGG